MTIMKDKVLHQLVTQIRPSTIDLLFAFEWPSNICKYSERAAAGHYSIGSPILEDFLSSKSSRYIFSIGENIFFEREPFENPSDPTTVSRFTSLANVGSNQKVPSTISTVL